MKEPPVVTPLDIKAPGSKTTGLKIPEGKVTGRNTLGRKTTNV